MFSRLSIFLVIGMLFTNCSNRFLGAGEEESKEKVFKSGSEKMNPYEIGGTTYYPEKVLVGTKIIGVVSWYGDDYHGKATANGETFNMYDLTSAHKTLPMNTMLLVRNLENGKSVIVRVNDRGPFVENRVLDLSKNAGQKIGIIKRGTTETEITVLGYNGQIDSSILDNDEESLPPKIVKENLPISQKNSNKNKDSSELPNDEVSPIFIQNTFQGIDIVENPVYIEKPTPHSIKSNSSKKEVVQKTEELKIEKRDNIENEDNSLEIIDNNNSNNSPEIGVGTINTPLENNSSEKWVEEITELVIKPQNEIKEDLEEISEVVYQRNYYVQVASFKLVDGAERFINDKTDLLPKNLLLITREEKKLFRIWVSGFKGETEAREFNHKKEFFPSSFLVYRDERVESK